jgi:transcriptional regulator with XRE-family HTH domain
MMTLNDLHKGWMENPKYREAHESMREEFEIAAAIIDVRARAGLTQGELADRMQVKQPFVARLESGSPNTTLKTLQRVAAATGTHLSIRFQSENEGRVL